MRWTKYSIAFIIRHTRSRSSVDRASACGAGGRRFESSRDHTRESLLGYNNVVDIATLTYPLKSHRKTINFPEESPLLAELMGIELGDGGINNKWQLVITLNSIADLVYSTYVKTILEQLFAVEVAVRKRKGKNALVLVCSSTSLVDFLVIKGAVRGNKIAQQIDIPAWISGKDEYEKNFVRGLVDTDGCLYVHRHTVAGSEYGNIGFCFSSYSPPLIRSVGAILKKFGITPHIMANETKIYLYSKKAVVDYLRIFGSSNPRILDKFEQWRGV